MNVLRSIGPALVVAAVVLGPGSILTSSRVGASIGLIGLVAIGAATLMMIAMVILATRIGVILQASVGRELCARLGSVPTIGVGVTLFLIVALFQSSNNIALIGGIEPLVGVSLSISGRIIILITTNAIVIICLYRVRELYRAVERAMKVLIGLTAIAFVLNAAAVYSAERDFTPITSESAVDWLALVGMIGTTFSVAGAMYHAYLVREKGWTKADLRSGTTDAVLSISALGIITAIILLTSYRVFHGRSDAPALASVADVAKQLEPLFGPWARVIFAGGILGGAISSFLVNALVGGTILSDCLGWGDKLEDRWPLHLTTLALLVGGGVAIASLLSAEKTVVLITIAQALTIIGVPALAAALIYLGRIPEVRAGLPRGILPLCSIGFLVSCCLASLTAIKLFS